MDRDNEAVEMPATRVDPVKFAQEDMGLDDDWQTLTHEDVRDLQKLFDFFVQQNPTDAEAAEEEEEEDYLDDYGCEDYEDEAGASPKPAAKDALVDAEAAKRKAKRKRMFTTRGMARLMQSMGLYPPFRDVQQMFNDTKHHIDHGRVSGDEFSPFIPSSDVRGLTYEDFVMFYALSSKDLSSEREVREAFRFLDDDFDGFVDVATMTPVLQHLLGLDAPRVHALLLKARVPAPPAARAGRSGHGAARLHADQALLSPREWLERGKLSYAEFVEFLQM